MTDAVSAPTPSTIPLIDIGAASARRLRRRSLANLSWMRHCAPTVMQTLLEASRVRAPWLVKAQEELRHRSLNVPFAAHDLMAELEGRRVVSAFDTLTPTGVHR
jgi:hypothetical protein